MDPDAKMNEFIWYRNDNDCIVSVDQYNERLKNWRGTIHNGQLNTQNLKNKGKTDNTCYNYSGSVRFNVIPR